ncbi:MAG TPA: DUF3536 domain-containing protein [Pyrinomonadaceae bacterium]|nr:DUF3536 domain-containing protein [Pyrinomonadaceae bacterium]
MTTALVIHGHFYQPTRENPWTGRVEREPGARPFHDWNERILAECYRPNAFAEIFDDTGRLVRTVNNYAHISFNFGPTLASWIERADPEVYQRILEADRESARRRAGHGNAIAQSYHHSILPLANARDLRTEIRWGMTDFRLRFRREPEAMWLPETACNDAVLCALIEEGLKYVILSPRQAARVRAGGADEWQDVTDGRVDATRAYKFLHRDGSGRSVAVFFYDGRIANAIAFEGVLASSEKLIALFEHAARDGEASHVSAATDGESYGHHYRHGERCLAYALEEVAPARGFEVTNFGEVLEREPPAWEVEISEGPGGEGTAWSCAHGVGRWRRDCGCHAGQNEGWNQAWRAPLREALDFLRDDAAEKFEEAGGALLRDPWAARDDYAELLVDRSDSARAEFLRRHAAHALTGEQARRVFTLLEAQRESLAMYTSCGWFFDDIAGLEASQVLRHAGRALELLDESGLDAPRARFLEMLAGARSNVDSEGNGADIFRRVVEASRKSSGGDERAHGVDERVADESIADESVADESVVDESDADERLLEELI